MMSNTKHISPKRLWLIPLAGLSFFLAGTWLLRPISDPDFFWHLKTGEWLWTRHSFPIPDPFSFTTPVELNFRQRFILTSYGLSQLWFFFCHSLAGWWGIYLLRLLMVGGLLGILFFWRQGQKLTWFFCSCVAVVLILESYPIERPQFFSFILFAGLFFYCDRRLTPLVEMSSPIREASILAFVMIVWANLHGGVILGQGLLAMALGITVTKLFRCLRQAENITAPLHLSGVILAGSAASFINPSGVNILRLLSEVGSTNKMMYAANEEYYSMLKVWQQTGDRTLLFCWLFMVLALIGLLRHVREVSFFRGIVLVGTGCYACLQVRYIPFFLLAALPEVTKALECKATDRRLLGIGSLCLLAVLVLFGQNEVRNWEQWRQANPVSQRDFPVKMADYMRQQRIDGRLFNWGYWGGYLIWQLGPDLKIFRDGRTLEEKIEMDGISAEMPHFRGADGRPIWKSIFERYQINLALLPLKGGGGASELAMAIYRDPDWQPLYLADNAVLFGRRTGTR